MDRSCPPGRSARAEAKAEPCDERTQLQLDLSSSVGDSIVPVRPCIMGQSTEKCLVAIEKVLEGGLNNPRCVICARLVNMLITLLWKAEPGAAAIRWKTGAQIAVAGVRRLLKRMQREEADKFLWQKQGQTLDLTDVKKIQKKDLKCFKKQAAHKVREGFWSWQWNRGRNSYCNTFDYVW